MTSVGRTIGDTASCASSLLRSSDQRSAGHAQVNRGRHQTPIESLEGLIRFSDDALFDLSRKEGDEARFLKSFNAAARREADGSENGGEPEAANTAAEQRVIAFAERPNWTGLPTVAAPAHEAKGAEPHLEALVQKLSQLIAKAISLEASPLAGQPIRLSLAFAEGNLGLSHLHVVLTASTLDVILGHHGAASGEELATAAALLADRLLIRFSKRSVRIIERITEDPQTPAANEAQAPVSQEPI